MSAIARRNAIENLHAPVLVVGADGVLGYANAAAHRVLGQAPGALAGLALADLFAASQRAELAPIFAAFASGGTCRVQSQVLRADGRVVDVAITVEPSYHESGQLHAYVVSLAPLAPWEAAKARKSGAFPVAKLR